MAHVIKTGFTQWEAASRDDFFQRIDARIKVLFLLFFVLIVSLKKDLLSEALVGASVFLLVVISRVNVFGLYRRVFFFCFFFGFLIAFPAAFNVITEGRVIFPVLHLSRPYSFWIYHIPQEIGLTGEGTYAVAMLTSRVMNSLALSFFVLYTTPFPEIVRALKALRVPDGFLMIVTLSYKYVFTFARTVEDMHLAKKSRLAGQASNADARGWIAGRLALLFRKSQLRCDEIFKAMQSRGFSEDVKIYEVRRLRAQDLAVGAVFFVAGVLFLWI